MEFWRFYRIIRKRRWLIILGMAICMAAVLAVNNYTASNPLYVGHTELMESTGMSREGTPIYPVQTLSLDVQLRLANLVRLATSPAVINQAAQTLSDQGIDMNPEDIYDPSGARKQVLSVQPVRDTNILAVEVRLPDPIQAATAAQVIATAFVTEYDKLSNEALTQSREFIQSKIGPTRQAMIDSQNTLKVYKENHDIVMLDQQSATSVQRLSQAKTDFNSANSLYLASTARVAGLEKELAGMKAQISVGNQIARNPAWERLQEQLASLETQKAGMTAGSPGQPRKGVNHPDALQIQRQIDDVKSQILKTAETYVASQSTGVNTIQQNALDKWVTEKAAVAGYDAQRKAYQQVISEAQAELTTLPADQARLAELSADANAAQQTYSLMRQKLDEATLQEQKAKGNNSLRIIGSQEPSQVDQKPTLKLILALLLSPILGIGVAMILHYTDNTVKTAADAEKSLGLPVLAEVPLSRAHSLARQKCPEVIDIAYQMLTSSLWIANQNKGVNSVVVVSASPDSGRSITASNLAVSLAREGARVVLVDADLRQPSLHLIMDVDNKIGLTNLLGGAATLEDVLVPTKIQGLLLIPSGPTPSNPVKLLRSSEMKDFAQQIQQVADFVVYDTAAGVSFPDPVLVASVVGNAIVAHCAGKVARGIESEFKGRLETIGVHLVGAVLNKVKREDSSGYFHYQRSYSGIEVGKTPGGK